MNAMNILNQLMNQASTSASSAGVDVKSLLGGGAMGLMIGSKRGRKIGGTALKYGAVAGVGALALKAYQNYQSQSSVQAGGATAERGAHSGNSGISEGRPLEQLQGQDQERRGLEILQAMIMAARADGHVDGNERAMLTKEIENLGPDDEMHAWIQQQFDAPLDANLLAQSADSPQASREIYLVSVAMIDKQNPMERAWLDQLASALSLEPSLASELERQVQSAAL